MHACRYFSYLRIYRIHNVPPIDFSVNFELVDGFMHIWSYCSTKNSLPWQSRTLVGLVLFDSNRTTKSRTLACAQVIVCVCLLLFEK